MAMASTDPTPLPPPPLKMPFEDFPRDVQLMVLSFLDPTDISSFASTSRRSASLCSQPELWHSMCDRRWGSRTRINSWACGTVGSGAISFSLLYKALHRWERLIGFWRRVGSQENPMPPLLFFEWGLSFITGYNVAPAAKEGSYDVTKVPFLWMGLSRKGDPMFYLCNGCRYRSEGDLLKLSSLGSGFLDPELVPVMLSLAEENYFILRENGDLHSNGIGGSEHRTGDEEDLMASSPPDRLMWDIYQYFANRTSLGVDRTSRRQRKKERERLGRRRVVTSHYVKITDCCPTPSRPLQGLWKGICENLNLVFFLLAYDDVGGIICRHISDSSQALPRYTPIFQASKANFMELPFPEGEEEIYNDREHIQPVNSTCNGADEEVVSRILTVYSSCEWNAPGLPGQGGDSRVVEGRIWEYESGTFGFGFLEDNFIVDVKHIALNGSLLDTVEHCDDASNP